MVFRARVQRSGRTTTKVLIETLNMLAICCLTSSRCLMTQSPIMGPYIAIGVNRRVAQHLASCVKALCSSEVEISFANMLRLGAVTLEAVKPSNVEIPSDVHCGYLRTNREIPDSFHVRQYIPPVVHQLFQTQLVQPSSNRFLFGLIRTFSLLPGIHLVLVIVRSPRNIPRQGKLSNLLDNGI